MEGQFDLIVIGAGPGGYVAAIKAAKLGLKTAVIENREVGGTCLNRGCIPAKAMIHASSIYREMQNTEEIGIFASEVTYDYGRILEYKEGTTRQLVQGIEQVLKANSVEIICGTGTLLPGNEVKDMEEQRDCCCHRFRRRRRATEGKGCFTGVRLQATPDSDSWH